MSQRNRIVHSKDFVVNDTEFTYKKGGTSNGVNFMAGNIKSLNYLKLLL